MEAIKGSASSKTMRLTKNSRRVFSKSAKTFNDLDWRPHTAAYPSENHGVLRQSKTFICDIEEKKSLDLTTIFNFLLVLSSSYDSKTKLVRGHETLHGRISGFYL
jgi:hypothetical protein